MKYILKGGTSDTRNNIDIQQHGWITKTCWAKRARHELCEAQEMAKLIYGNRNQKVVALGWRVGTDYKGHEGPLRCKKYSLPIYCFGWWLHGHTQLTSAWDGHLRSVYCKNYTYVSEKGERAIYSGLDRR